MGEFDAEAEAARQMTWAEGFFELGDSVEALRIVSALPMEAQRTWRAQLLRALLLMSLERWPEAEAVAAAAVAARDGPSVLWYSLAVAQAQQQKLAEARESLRWAFDLDEELRDVAQRDVALAGVW
jgi:thioredoxin-like negative regulator of GroEL